MTHDTSSRAIHGRERPGDRTYPPLDELSGLRQRARADRHAYWLPFPLFSALIGLAIPFWEFGHLKSTLELTAGNLSRHITVLEEAGLLEVEKGYDGKRPKTWVDITTKGRSALAPVMAALRALLDRHARH